MIDDKYAAARKKQIAKDVADAKKKAAYEARKAKFEEAMHTYNEDDPVEKFVGNAASTAGEWAYDHRKEILVHSVEIGVTATITAVACGATAGAGCVLAVGVAFGSLWGGSNYMMTTPKSQWTRRNFLIHEYFGAATGGIGARLGIGGKIWSKIKPRLPLPQRWR